MAQHYRGIIVQALIEFDNSHPNELYQALAWEGLMSTIAWNNLSEQERIDILQLIQDFEN